MKRKIIIALVCVVIIALGVFIDKGADRDIEDSKPKIPERKIEPEDNRLENMLAFFEGEHDDEIESGIDKDVEDQNFSSLKHAAYTEDGFYVYDKSSCLVSFIDKKTCEMVPLCSKPDCFHDDMECDAYYLMLDAIFVYDTKLYVVANNIETHSMCLYRINRDGSERTLIKTLFAIENDSAYSCFFVLHKGCLYMGMDFWDDERETMDDAILYGFPLDSNERKEILKHTEYNADIMIYNCDEDNIYIRQYNHTKPGVPLEEIVVNYCYNINDGILTEIKIPEGHYMQCCFDGKISTNFDEYDNENNRMKMYQAYQSDMDGSNSKCIYSNENFAFNGYCTDSKYRYFIIEKEDKKHLVIVSHDGKEVYQTESKDYYMVWSNKKKVLLKSESTGRYALCDIKSGKIKEVWEK